MQQVLHNRVFKEREPSPLGVWETLSKMYTVPKLSNLKSAGIFLWTPKYTRAKFIQDMSASLTVAVILVPQGMAYSLLAGLPPVYGLYSSTVPVIIYGLITSSSCLAPGPVAPTAIVMNAMVTSMTSSAPLSPEFIRIHLALGFTTGVLQLAMGLLQLTWVSDLVSYPVMNGFAFGAALIINASQLGDLFGLAVTRESGFFNRVIAAGRAVGNSGNWYTTILSLSALYILLQFRTWKFRGWYIPKKFPMPLVIILLLTLLSFLIDLKSYGIKLVGTIPSSMPPPSMPIQGSGDIALVASNAAILAVINYMQSVSLAKIFGQKVGEHTVPELEMFALGSSSVVGSFMSCYTIAGSFTRTTVQFEAGAVTPATTILTGLLMIIFLITITRILNFLPVCILAAVVVSSTRQLFATDVALELWRGSRSEFFLFFATFLGVLFLDIVYGLLAGIGISLLTILLRSFLPLLVELGRLPGTESFVALSRFAEAHPIPGLTILRLNGELHFGNIRRVTERINTLLLETKVARLKMISGGEGGGVSLLVPRPEAAAISAPSSSEEDTTHTSDSPQGLLSTFWSRIRFRGATRSGTPLAAEERSVYALSAHPAVMVKALKLRRSLNHSSNTDDETVDAERASTHDTLAPDGYGRERWDGNYTDAEKSYSGDAHGNGPSASHGSSITPKTAIILDCSRVTSVDSTTCKELLEIIHSFMLSREAAKKFDAQTLGSRSASVPSASAPTVMGDATQGGEGGGTVATLENPPAMTDISGTGSGQENSRGAPSLKPTLAMVGSHTKLLLAAFPGPIRDILDKFNTEKLDLSSTRFLTLSSAVAYINELEDDKEDWGVVAQELSVLSENIVERRAEGSALSR